MTSMSNMSWWLKSIVSLALLTPAWLAIPFFQRNFKVEQQTFLVWYFLGVVIGTMVMIHMDGATLAMVLPSKGLVGAVLAFGIICGSVANSLLFRAVGEAPNPGLPVAIANGASALVFLASVILGSRLPRYFEPTP